MFTEFLASSDLLIWPLVALGVFFLTFVGVLVYVAFGMRGPRLDRLASLPLDRDSSDGEE